MNDNIETPQSLAVAETQGAPIEELERAIKMLKPSFYDPHGAALTLAMMLRKRGVELVKMKAV